MILSDKMIMKMLADRTLTIAPMETRQIQPASLSWRQRGNTFPCRMILPRLWKGAVPLAVWACLYRMPAGWTRVLRGRSPRNCSGRRTAVKEEHDIEGQKKYRA